MSALKTKNCMMAVVLLAGMALSGRELRAEEAVGGNGNTAATVNEGNAAKGAVAALATV